MSATSEKPAGATAVRPFRVEIPQAEVDELRRRIAATRWPEKETVDDGSQGTPLAKLQELVRYWGTDYDCRRFEARLNALPQFVTSLDGLDIHFIHVRSPHPDALPLIMTHGWPGSIVELLRIIEPLTDPTAHGGRDEDAFHLVLPSLPGYGFSEKPTSAGWNPDHIARTWAELVTRLGYTRYVSQGGDWGSVVTEAMGRQAPAGLLGIHVNLPATVPADVAAALAAGGPAPEGLSEDERASFDKLATGIKTGGRAYFAMLTARPQNMGYGMADSPAGLAAWMLVHGGFTQWTYEDDAKGPQRKTRYWTTSRSTGSRTPGHRRDASTGRTAEQTRTARLHSALTRSRSPWRSPCSPARAIKHREAGPSARIPTSSISARSIEADTSRPGSSRNSSQKRFARRFGR
jgi:pimeloyl-ACP methyl ester carboxylesterase